MNINLFGNRCVIEYFKPKTKSTILIPDVAQQHDTHRTGIVRYVGDGKVKGKDAPVASLVKVGDLVMFQINAMMEATQTFVREGRTYMSLLQTDLLARFENDTGKLEADWTASYENMEMLGDFVLVKCHIRASDSKLVVPEAIAKTATPDMVYFECVKKGSSVGSDIGHGDELVVSLARVTPIFVKHRNKGADSKYEEYAYTLKDWIEGVIESENTRVLSV